MPEGGVRLLDLERWPDVELAWLSACVEPVLGAVAPALMDRAVIDIRYQGKVVRQDAKVRCQADFDSVAIPEPSHSDEIRGLRREAVETLERFRKAIGVSAEISMKSNELFINIGNLLHITHDG
jgi:tRNA U34 5-carboxymethylaminomethyl modifying enzyme MnmG/GidA